MRANDAMPSMVTSREARTTARRARAHVARRLLTLFVAAGLLAAQASSVAAAAPQGDAVIAYWTPERMASARTRNFVFAAGASQGTLVSESVLQSTLKGTQPAAGSIGNTSGASWPTDDLAMKATGKVFFTMGTTNYVCSGAVVDDAGRSGYSMVLTAGHCAYDQASKTFATYWMFVPSYDTAPTSACANTRYGCWVAKSLVVHMGFASQPNFNNVAVQYDWAFAVVETGGKGGTVDPQLDKIFGGTFAGFPLLNANVTTVTTLSSGWKSVAFGYPAAAPYNGRDLTYCAGSTSTDAQMSNKTWSLSCKMTGGSSGGPWFSNFSVDQGVLSSLNSYGYNNVKGVMYGPMFNSNTNNTYAAALGATTTNIIYTPTP